MLENKHTRIRKAILSPFVLLGAAFLIVGCRAPVQSPMDGALNASSVPNAATDMTQTGGQSPLSSQQGKQRMDSPLAQLLRIFVSPEGSTWAAYDSATAVTWRDQSPTAAGTGSGDATYQRGGKLTLAGFPEVDLPDGEVGIDAGSRRGNEGESGVTLFGTMDTVTSFAVRKFYPSEGYAQVLDNQLADDAAIKIIADHCGDEDPEARQFFQLQLSSAGTSYVEAYVNAEGGKYSPGSTTFEFYRTAPVDHIQKFGCQNR